MGKPKTARSPGHTDRYIRSGREAPLAEPEDCATVPDLLPGLLAEEALITWMHRFVESPTSFLVVDRNTKSPPLFFGGGGSDS